MSSDEALASRAKRLSAWQADRTALLGQADAFVVVFAFCVIASNFVMDLLNFLLDPRVRTA